MPLVVALSGCFQLIVLEVITQSVGNSDQRGNDVHSINALPSTVLGGNGVNDRSVREVMGGAALGSHASTLRQRQDRRECRHVGIAPHGKRDNAIGREDNLHRVSRLKEKVLRSRHMQGHRLDIGLTAIGLVAA